MINTEPDEGILWLHARMRRFPLLTQAEEVELGRIIQSPESSETEKQKAIESFVSHNLRLASSVAKKYNWCKSHTYLDLVNVGVEGLHTAATRFDPARGYRFSTYSYFWVRQAITRAIENESRTIRVPVQTGQLIPKMRELMDKMKASGIVLDKKQMAAQLGCTLRQFDLVIDAMNPVFSLDFEDKDREDSPRAFLEAHESGEPQPLDLIMKNEQYAMIFSFLDRLPPLQKTVIEARFGLIHGVPIPLKDLADQMGLSEAKVRSLQSGAMRKLRQMAIYYEGRLA